jgi:hypothetical protein
MRRPERGRGAPKMINEYSPNIEWGKQAVEIVLMQWAYKATFTMEVGGNCTGFPVIECALDNLYENLMGEDTDIARVTLTNDGERNSSHVLVS